MSYYINGFEVNIDEILFKFGEWYELLYEHDRVVRLLDPENKVMECGEKLIRRYPEVYRAFCKANEDALTSDRELRAYAFALCDLYNAS